MIGVGLLVLALVWMILAGTFADTEGPVWPLSLVGCSLTVLAAVYFYMEDIGL